MKDTHIPKLVYESIPNERRSISGPSKRWHLHPQMQAQAWNGLHPISAADNTFLYVIFVFLHNTLFTIFTKDILKHCTLLTQCTCAFLILFAVNADCFHKRRSLILLYNNDGVRFLWGTNCISICNLRYAVHLLECVQNCVILLWVQIIVFGPLWKQCWRGYIDVRRILHYYYFLGGVVVVVLWKFAYFSKCRIHVKWVRL